MPLDNFALITLDDYKSYADIESSDIEEKDAIALYSDDGSAATVEKSGDTITLTKTGGTGTSQSVDLTLATNDTLGELVSVIDGYAGWSCRCIGWAGASSTDIKDMAETDCLESAREVKLTYDDNFIYERMIDRASQIIENFLRRNIKTRSYTHERYSGDGSQYLYVNNYPLTAIAQLCIGSLDVIRIKYTSTTQRNAYATVSTDGVILTVDGSAGSEITFASFATLTLLAAEINGNASWEAVVVSSIYGGYPSDQLYPQQNIFALDEYAYLAIPDEPVGGHEVEETEGLIYLPGGFTEGFKNIFLSSTGGYLTVPDAIKHGTCRFVSFMDDKRTIDENMKSESKGDYSYTAKDLKDVLTLKEFKELKAYQKPLVGDIG